MITHLRILSALLCVAFLISTASAQDNQTEEEKYLRTQYKKQNRNQVTKIALGKPGEALEYSREYLAAHPKDLEARYIQVMALSKLGKTREAMTALRKSVEMGLPFNRYVAGPRNLFANLYRDAEFQKLSRQRKSQLLHGPVLGSVTDGRARIWVRTADEVPIRMIVSRSANLADAKQSAVIHTRKADDYTAVAEVDELTANTVYYYGLEIDGKAIPLDPQPSFRTFPKTGSSARFDVGFGGGAGFTPWNEHMWTTILKRKPNAFFLLGDNVYIDTPAVPETQRYCYYRRQSRPEYRAFARSTPIFSIWDDHDFGDNDCTSSLSLTDPPWKRDVLNVFQQNFVNPSYGGGAKRPGVWFDISIGDVDVFFLDTRFYRQNPKKIDHPSMLGPDQLRWLKARLKQSQATFKIIASSVPWAPGTKGGSKDTWDGFPEQREEIFSFLHENRIDGVVLISADRHRSDAWKVKRKAGYPLYDLMSSKLTNVVSHKLIPGSLFGYNKKCSYGRLSFDTTKSDPELTYRIVNIDDKVMHSLRIKRSQLQTK